MLGRQSGCLPSGLPSSGRSERVKHREFAEKAARRLEDLAEVTREEESRVGYGITSMRANELMVAARVVRDLSLVATREEERVPRDARDPSTGESVAC